MSPAAPRSWSETSSPRSSSSRQHSISFFSSNGSPICTRRPLLLALGELRRGEHRGPADPVPAGRGPQQHQGVARPGGGRAHHAVLAGEPDAHRVDQAVALVGRLEVDLAPDGRHPDRVAVVADALDHPLEQEARSLARRARRSAASRGRRSAARPARRRRGGCRRLRLLRPGTALRRSDGCAIRP